jgi:hypothetical protein
MRTPRPGADRVTAMSSPLVVERITGCDARTLYREYVDQSRPVILTDACDSWPARNTWSLADLRSRFGDRRFRHDGRETTLEQALAAVENASPDQPAPYVRECYLVESVPELVAEVWPLPGNAYNRLMCRALPIAEKDRGLPELLIAGQGRHFPSLHYDTMHCHAFITQLRGKKTFWIYRPDQGRYLYPREDRPNLSRIDSFNPVDTTRWPDYALAQSTEVVVHPGETIFVPSGF